MSPELIGVIGIVVLIVLMFLGMWIGAAMTFVGFVGILLIRGANQAFIMLGALPYQNIAFYTITAIPLFVLMGIVIANSGIGESLYYTAYKLIGQFRGGLAMATVLACALLAAITGLSAPAVVTMGKIALPEMLKYKYDEKMATGSIACAGTLAFLIPPSLAFILYGLLTEQSVGKLFIAGILPGLLLAFLFIATIYIITRIRPQAGPQGPKTTILEKIKSLKGTWHMVLLFLLVLGGIYGGIFTPTEAGAVGAFGAIVIAAASKRLDFNRFRKSILEATQFTAMILLLLVGAFIFSHFMAVSKIPIYLGEVVASLHVPTVFIIVLIIIMYLILGMFLDIMSAVVLTIPVIYPIIKALGVDPIWFGVLVVILIEAGLVTPPVGMEVFILSGISGIPVSTIFRGVFPFLLAVIVCIILLILFPQIALFLPNTM